MVDRAQIQQYLQRLLQEATPYAYDRSDPQPTTSTPTTVAPSSRLMSSSTMSTPAFLQNAEANRQARQQLYTEQVDTQQGAPVQAAPTRIEKDTKGVVAKEKGTPKGVMMDGFDKNSAPVTIFSSTPRTESDYASALDQYNNSGKLPKGYVVLPVGATRTMREGFEKTVGASARAVGEYGASREQGPGILAPGSSGAPNPLYLLAQLAKQAAPVAAEPFRTPGGALSTVGTAIGTAASRGLNLIPGMIRTGVAGGLGEIAGQQLFGTAQQDAYSQISQPLGTAIIAGMTQGAAGVVKHALGATMSQRAHSQVVEGIAGVIKGEHPHIASNPNALGAYLDTPGGLAKVSQMGVRAVMDDVSRVSDNLLTQMQQSLPHSLSKGAQNTMRAQLRHVVNASSDALDNLNDTKNIQHAIATMRDAVQHAAEKVEPLLRQEFKKLPQAVQDAAVSRVTSQLIAYADSTQRYLPTVALFKALKDSGTAKGFDVRKFQQTVQGIYGQQPGSLLERAGQIAGRGAELTDEVDTAIYRFGMEKTPRVRILGTQFGGGSRKPIGTRYAGTVRGDYPATTAIGTAGATSVVINNIKKFLEE